MTGFAYLPAYRSSRAPARVALIGFDDAAQRIAATLASAGTTVAAYDRAFQDPCSAISRSLRRSAVTQFASAEGAVADADLIVVSVAGDLLFDTARRIAALAEPRTWFCDCTDADEAMVRRSRAALSSNALRYAKGTLSTSGQITFSGVVADLAATLGTVGLGDSPQSGAQIIPFPGPRQRISPNGWQLWREMIA